MPRYRKTVIDVKLAVLVNIQFIASSGRKEVDVGNKFRYFRVFFSSREERERPHGKMNEEIGLQILVILLNQ